MNKPVYWDLLISKIVLYEVFYVYVTPKYEKKKKVKARYVDTESFIVYIKTEELYSEISKNFSTRFDTSN